MIARNEVAKFATSVDRFTADTAKATGGDRKSEAAKLSRQVGDDNDAERFTADTAASTGKSERLVRLEAERAER